MQSSASLFGAPKQLFEIERCYETKAMQLVLAVDDSHFGDH